MIGTDCTGSCKSNYHTITATTAPSITVGDIGIIIKGQRVNYYMY